MLLRWFRDLGNVYTWSDWASEYRGCMELRLKSAVETERVLRLLAFGQEK